MKKLSKILAKLRAASAATEQGACCCRDLSTMDVLSCTYSDALNCGSNVSPIAAAFDIHCTFYAGYSCEEVCSNGFEGDLIPTDLDTIPKPPVDPAVDTGGDPSGAIDTGSNGGGGGGGGGAGGGGGGGGGPVPCPTSPINIPTDCELEASDVAACLEILMVGSNADHPTAKLLRGLVVGWGRYRCPEVRSLCYHAAQGNVGCYPGMTITDMKCYCRIHEEYWKGLKRIVEEFCAGNSSGEKVRTELTKLCKQLKLARNRCAGNDGLPRDPIKDSDNSLSLNCGIKRVD